MKTFVRFIKALICTSAFAVIFAAAINSFLGQITGNNKALNITSIAILCVICSIKWVTNFSTRKVKIDMTQNYSNLKKAVTSCNYKVSKENRKQIIFVGESISKRAKWLFSEGISISIIDNNNIQISGPTNEIKNIISKLEFLVRSQE